MKATPGRNTLPRDRPQRRPTHWRWAGPSGRTTGLVLGKKDVHRCVLLSEQDERVQSQGLGQAAAKGQEEASLHLAFKV